MSDADRIAALERKVNELCRDHGLSPVTLPPEPPALVTMDMLAEAWPMGLSASPWSNLSDKQRATELRYANHIVESAIRLAVERKTERDGFVEVATRGGIRHWVDRNALLALFGLEAS